jgi:hypothetical protein
MIKFNISSNLNDVVRMIEDLKQYRMSKKKVEKSQKVKKSKNVKKR